jgi:aryl-alcohol dehydrogenase-like predicted oxidoreductase
METRRIGSLEVSVVGLGCNNFGRRVDEAGTATVVHAALDAGINFFDTADTYGTTKSEEFLGQLFKGRRSEVIIATKFGSRIDEQRLGGGKPAYIRQAAEDSLRRLQTDYIDLYQLHQPDADTPIADTLGALDELVKAGKVREIGCSNFSVAQLREAEAAVQPGAARFVSVQNEYNMIHREPEQEVLAECARTGVGYLPFFPLASGLFTGKYRKGHAIPEGTRLQAGARQLTEENLSLVESLTQFAESRGYTLLELAVSWLASQPVIASVIAGATKPDQVKANAAAANWRLTDADFAEVNTLLSAHH